MHRIDRFDRTDFRPRPPAPERIARSMLPLDEPIAESQPTPDEPAEPSDADLAAGMLAACGWAPADITAILAGPQAHQAQPQASRPERPEAALTDATPQPVAEDPEALWTRYIQARDRRR